MTSQLSVSFDIIFLMGAEESFVVIFWNNYNTSRQFLHHLNKTISTPHVECFTHH